MPDYKVGYGKPPHHSRFKKNQSGNPTGGWPRKTKSPYEEMKSLMNMPIEYKDGSKWKRAPGIVVLIKAHIAEALKGNVSSAASLLKIYEHCEKFGDVNPIVIFMTELEWRL